MGRMGKDAVVILSGKLAIQPRYHQLRPDAFGNRRRLCVGTWFKFRADVFLANGLSGEPR